MISYTAYTYSRQEKIRYGAVGIVLGAIIGMLFFNRIPAVIALGGLGGMVYLKYYSGVLLRRQQETLLLQFKDAMESMISALSAGYSLENSVYEAFINKYRKVNNLTGKEQYLVPYLMSSHPGSTMKDAIALAEYIRDIGYMPEQVQDFYPTPSTISTCMYYTGVDPRNMEKVYVPRNPHEKAMQRALIQYRKPENYDLVKEALIKGHREDLIGFSEKCLIRPRKPASDTDKKSYAGRNDNAVNDNGRIDNKHKSKSGSKTNNKNGAPDGRKGIGRNKNRPDDKRGTGKNSNKTDRGKRADKNNPGTKNKPRGQQRNTGKGRK